MGHETQSAVCSKIVLLLINAIYWNICTNGYVKNGTLTRKDNHMLEYLR